MEQMSRADVEPLWHHDAKLLEAVVPDAKPQNVRGMEATWEMNYCAFCPFGLTRQQQVALCDDVGTGLYLTYIIFSGVCVHSDVNFLIQFLWDCTVYLPLF